MDLLKNLDNMSKVKTKTYISCPRCKTNNFDDPTFWGCPRGSCEAEYKGIITETLILDKKK